jgi:hypothetical protein
MPDLCRGSGSSANPVYGTVVAVTSTAIEAFLVTRMPRPVAQFFSPILAGITYDLETVCSGQAPTPVALTDQDVRDLSNIADPIPYFLAANKLKDWFLAQYWGVICVCGDGQPAAPVSAPALPTVGVNPGLPTGSPAPPCWDMRATTTQAVGTTPAVVNNMTARYLPGPLVTGMTGVGTLDGASPIPPGTTQFTWSASSQWDQAGTGQAFADLVIFDDTKTVIAPTPTLCAGNNVGAGETLDLPAGAKYLMIRATNNVPTSTWTMDLEVQMFCEGQPPGSLVTPCCPPDPIISRRLDQILGLVTLLQRQVAPFAYVPGVLHSALTGHGELSVQGLLGVKVTPTTVPPGVGVDLGDPDTLWLESWINWGNPDGWHEREFLRSSPHVSLPALAGQYTKLGYTLRPGLVVDILELKREP